MTSALDLITWRRRGCNEVVVAATCNCPAAMSLSGYCRCPRRRRNFSDNWRRDHNVTIAANLPTHPCHGYAMLQLTGGILMSGDKGVIVAVGHGLCVFLCVFGETTIN
jgi:hypothetical protein